MRAEHPRPSRAERLALAAAALALRRTSIGRIASQPITKNRPVETIASRWLPAVAQVTAP